MNRQSVNKTQEPKKSTTLFSARGLQSATAKQKKFTEPALISHNSTKLKNDFGSISINSNTNHFLQAKLKIGQANDKYEQEADRVADHIMRMPNFHPSFPNNTYSTPQTSVIQRACSSCSSEFQSAAEENRATISTKLCPQCRDTEQDLIQRQEENEEEEEEEELIQTKSNTNSAPTVTPEISSGIQSLRGGGRPMSKSERNFFEPRFAANFGNVRIHENEQSSKLAQSINARAFTVGQQIVFGNNGTPSDKKLLAHELTHVMQQSGGNKTTHVSQSIDNTTQNKPANTIQRTADDPPRCENPQDKNTKVRNFRNQVIRQIGRNRSLRDVTLPPTPPLPATTARSLIDRLNNPATPPQLSNPSHANLARISLEALIDTTDFVFNTVNFFVCDSINMPELAIREGQQFGGFVDTNQTPIAVYYPTSFETHLDNFMQNDDLDALRSAIELISHEKRHVDLASTPDITVPESSLEEGADQNRVNYYIEELLVTAEEIRVQYAMNPQYVVPAAMQYQIREFWRYIERSVNATEAQRIRNRIQEILRDRYGSGTCDNAISTGMLCSMSFEQWYRCGTGGRVIRVPEGVTPCAGENNSHAICRGATVPESSAFPPGMNL